MSAGCWQDWSSSKAASYGGKSVVLKSPSQIAAAITIGRFTSARFARTSDDPIACIIRIGLLPMPGP